MLPIRFTMYFPAWFALMGLSMMSAPAAQLSWVAGADGAWEDGANWLTDDDVPVNRVPADGDMIRPVAADATITFSNATGTQALGSSIIIQDASATTGFLQTGGDLTVNQISLAKRKTNDSAGFYTMTGGRLFVNRQMTMTWSNSGDIDSRFVQVGGSVRIGDGANEGLFMCGKSDGQAARYDLQGGDFEARLIRLGAGGANSSAIFNQSAGTTAIINEQLRLGEFAGTTGAAIYNLDGGTLTIQAAVDPFLFAQPGAPVYLDFDGGTLNLKGTWDFATLMAIANSDFRIAGVPASAGNLVFTPITIGTEVYTQISTQADSDPVISSITSITSLGGGILELTLLGEADTAYEFRSSPELRFDPGSLVTNLSAGDPSVGTIGGDDKSVVTTSDNGDGSGEATVRMILTGSANFVVARSQSSVPGP